MGFTIESLKLVSTTSTGLMQKVFEAKAKDRQSTLLTVLLSTMRTQAYDFGPLKEELSLSKKASASSPGAIVADMGALKEAASELQVLGEALLRVSAAADDRVVKINVSPLGNVRLTAAGVAQRRAGPCAARGRGGVEMCPGYTPPLSP
jgi:hypothetical protein